MTTNCDIIESCHVLFLAVCTRETKADIAFLLDSSGSIRDNNPADKSYDNWNLVLTFLADIVAR